MKMEHKSIVTRLDEILTELPNDQTALSVCVRYGGLPEVQAKLLRAIQMLRQLKNDLE
jgi:hypothetical protein